MFLFWINSYLLTSQSYESFHWYIELGAGEGGRRRGGNVGEKGIEREGGKKLKEVKEKGVESEIGIWKNRKKKKGRWHKTGKKRLRKKWQWRVLKWENPERKRKECSEMENLEVKTEAMETAWVDLEVGKWQLEEVYRTSGVIFFIDYCTAIRDT